MPSERHHRRPGFSGFVNTDDAHCYKHIARCSTRCQQTRPLLVSGCVTLQRDVAMSAGDRPAQADAEFDLATSFDLPAHSHETPANETQSAASDSEAPPKGKRRNLVLDLFVVLGVAVVYLL